MSTTLETKSLTATEVSQRGQQIYAEQIQSLLEPQSNGKYLSIDIFSKDWEVGDKHSETLFKLRQRHPQGRFYTLRIGSPVAGYVGSAG
ncbi:hypothetical protein [Armatimonas sp.]|uniref:hypothetical protein n=1 Tax=Armatimonas sp. TaxID=1872638 RepID=UPI00375017E9